MAFLEVVEGPARGQVWTIKEPRCVLGRHPDCDLLLESLDASRQHAQIVAIAGDYFVEDLDSRNGTWVNHYRVRAPQKLEEGDCVRLGALVVSFHRGDTHARPLGATAVIVSGEQAAQDVYAVLPCDTPSWTATGRSAYVLQAELNALVEITQSLRNTLALDEIFPQVLEALFKIFPTADRGLIVLCEAGSEMTPRWLKVRPGLAGQDVPISSTIVRQAIESRQAVLSADATADSRFRHAESVSTAPIRSVMCAPLTAADGRPFGVLQLDTFNLQARFREDDLHVLVAVASQASIAIENARLHAAALRERSIQRDLELADHIQRSFLPDGPPRLPGYRFFDYYRPASHVSGDFYHYIPLPGGRLAIVVADVAGHGLAAAMITAKVGAEIRYHLLTVDRPGDVVTRLNRSLPQKTDETPYVTLVLAVLAPETGRLTLVNAGHPRPLLRPPGGPLVELGAEEACFPLGVIEDAAYGEHTCEVPRGALVLFYTDGIDEAMNAQEKVYGVPRLRQRLREAPDDPAEFGRRLIDDVGQFVGDAEPTDDRCLICLRRD